MTFDVMTETVETKTLSSWLV